MDSLVIMHSMDTDSRHWIDVPGWPRAHIHSDQGYRLLVLTDELETGLIGHGPIWLIVCPHCRVNPVAIAAKDIRRKFRLGRRPGCGCANPGHENFRGNYREHFG